MNKRLPRLRAGLDIFPSPLPDRPGLLIRDPFRYADEMLIVPPLLARGLLLFDGEQTVLDLQAYLSRLAGEIIPGDAVSAMVSVLDDNGFLESEELARRRELRHAEFAAMSLRMPAHSGSGYPDHPDELRSSFDENLLNHDTEASTSGSEIPLGIAAPHVSPEGGWSGYSAAYNRLDRVHAESFEGKTVVILGTSHYGAPERFGLTRKPFETPLGAVETDAQLVDRLFNRAGRAVDMEDYCHSIEHSIEFQAVFLKYKIAANFKILPILCGPFVKALLSGDPPEADDDVRRFLDTLGELGDEFNQRLIWVLGVDLSHIGARYGDPNPATSFYGEMLDVRQRDEERIERVCAGDARGFFDLVYPNRDPLKWCGLSPIYTFLAAQPEAKGRLLKYDQWNIDEQSVVSFAALEFSRGT
ncbi:MAG: AmmeMemoRadiSam system protein B [Acidobacteria bacterium]|nr:AmmeMemoRadiSam system protein B [Acidobacteriota bacterium]